MLYICGTPIGNLEDITMRQLRILQEVDLIAAEDTRHSRKLLHHFDIKTPMISYHEHSNESKTDELLKQLLAGKKIAIISDSGMPVISDPGFQLVTACNQLKIPVTTVPGPTAFVSALLMSGFNPDSFVFLGFLNKKQKKDLSFLHREDKTVLIYEAPHKLVKTLTLFQEQLNPQRKIAIAREITKLYEEVLHVTIQEACDYYQEHQPMGEYVLVLAGEVIKQEKNEMPISDQVVAYQQKGISKKDAIKQVAKDMDLPKNEVYKEVITLAPNIRHD